jgi:hypothetical protein
MPALRIVPLALAAAVWSEAARAAPADVRACSAAHQEAQVLHNQGAVRQARARLAECATDRCPALVRKDCTEWAADWAKEQPTILVTASGANVHVVVDGASVDGENLGRPIDVDPGEHRVRCVRSDGAEAEQTLLVGSGERGVSVRCTFPEPQRREVLLRHDPPPPKAGSRIGPGVVALGATSVVAMGVFTYFALTGLSKERDLEQTCGPRCAPSDADGVRSRYLVADVSLVVGIASFAAAALWYALTPRHKNEP